MPRRPRGNTGGIVFHVLNRAVRRFRLFEHPADYELLLTTMRQAQARVPVRILSYAIMPNHWHFVMWPREDGDLARLMHWFTATHTRRWHLRAGTTGTGPIYQGRYKAIPVFTDEYLLSLLRYAERNPQSAGLVARARDWPYSSLAQRKTSEHQPLVLSPWPIGRPDDWVEFVESCAPYSCAAELAASLRYGTPLGPAPWRERIARQLGIEASLRRPGRPPILPILPE